MDRCFRASDSSDTAFSRLETPPNPYPIALAGVRLVRPVACSRWLSRRQNYVGTASSCQWSQDFADGFIVFFADFDVTHQGIGAG